MKIPTNKKIQKIFSLLTISFLLVGISYAHTVKPTGVKVSKEVAERICKRQGEVAEKRKLVVSKIEKQREEKRKIEDAILKYQASQTTANREILNKELEKINSDYEAIYDAQVELVQSLVEIEEQMCGGDIGYVRQEGKKVKADMNELNKKINKLKLYIKQDLKNKIKKM